MGSLFFFLFVLSLLKNYRVLLFGLVVLFLADGYFLYVSWRIRGAVTAARSHILLSAVLSVMSAFFLLLRYRYRLPLLHGHTLVEQGANASRRSVLALLRHREASRSRALLLLRSLEVLAARQLGGVLVLVNHRFEELVKRNIEKVLLFLNMRLRVLHRRLLSQQPLTLELR